MLKIKKTNIEVVHSFHLRQSVADGRVGRNSCSTRIQSGRNRNCRNGVSYFQSDV